VKFILISWSIFFFTCGFSQRYNFFNYSLEAGLPQSQVSDICQDQFGYLWIGTETGLSRFDGIEFINFSTDDGLPDNEIDKLFIDAQNQLWVATPKGISRYDNRQFVSFPFSNSLSLEYNINDLCEFNQKIYLAADEGLLIFDKDTFLLLTIGNEEANTIRTICNSGDSLLICGSKNGLYKFQNNQYLKFGYSKIDTVNISDIFLRKDELIISTYGFGVLSYNFRTQLDSAYSLSTERIRAMYASPSSILCATKNGAFEITENETYYYSLQNGLIFENIRCVFIDNESNIWLGTNGKGLLKLTGKSILSYTKSDGLSSDAVMGIAQDHEGYYYFGTYEAGVTKWKENGDSSISEVFNLELKNSTIWVTVVDKHNRCWIGSSGGVDCISENRLIKNLMLEELNSKTRTILFLNDSTQLFGGSSGIFSVTNSKITKLFSNQTLDINKMVLLNGVLFVATTTGLYRSSLATNLHELSFLHLPENNVKTMAVDFAGNLWIGTNSSGVYIYLRDGKTVSFALDNTDSKSNTVLAIIADSKNCIWVSTLNGVYQVQLLPESETLFTINHYGRAEGLMTLECNQNALFEDMQHFIWVGTSEGLARIDPSLNDELFSFQKPKLRISGIRLFMENFDYEDYKIVLDTASEVPSSITLPYNKNHLTFDFIGINLKDPEGVRYEYRLLGAEDYWSPLTATSYATYSFISHGEYSFEVRATNTSGEWSETNRIQVIILPPYWLTWWFITLMILFGIFILVLIFQIRIKAIKQKQENERLGFKNRLLFLEQQSLNASMNRHFIFNSLNSIQYFINSSNKLAANKYLTSFAKLIRKNLDSSTTNNFIVTLQEEIERIELYLSLEKMRFDGKFEYFLEVDKNIELDGLDIPSMILQPFVENSIIHGVLPVQRKGKITIKIFKEHGFLVFEVIDDGYGIDNSMNLKKNKVTGDHESMGMDITTRRIELIRKLTGENLMIIGPFQVNNEAGECLGTKVIIKINVESQIQD